jgi:chromosome segregation ATPase
VTGPGGEPPLDTLPPDAPATVEDVRAGRRWTIVALVWAVAASAIAVIALIQANNNDNSSGQTQTQTSQSVSPKDLEDFQKQVNDRLDAFSRRLNDTASSADLQKLDKRLSQVEDDLSKAQNNSGKQSDSITQLQSDVKDLQQRVDQLESQQSGGGTTTTP